MKRAFEAVSKVAARRRMSPRLAAYEIAIERIARALRPAAAAHSSVEIQGDGPQQRDLRLRPRPRRTACNADQGAVS